MAPGWAPNEDRSVNNSKSQVMLITGAASGIGAATAKLAVERGHKVVLADINVDGARAIADQLGEASIAVKLDIVSPAEWENAFDITWKSFGRLDVLINNAAIVHTGYARDVSIERHRQTMDVNFLGPVTGALAALPRFKAQGHGHVMTVCSMTAFIPFPGLSSYAAAKHALRAFHHALALEERDGPVKFSIIHPTSTETPMLEKEAEDDALTLAFAGPSVTPQFVAEAILEAIRKGSIEVYMPPERGKVAKRTGVSPRLLRAMVERNEIVGAERLKLRRANLAQKAN
jgi:NAD(P)-dependent dehydrogenase (short-subunit alcohol dehydrogenase family)